MCQVLALQPPLDLGLNFCHRLFFGFLLNLIVPGSVFPFVVISLTCG